MSFSLFSLFALVHNDDARTIYDEDNRVEIQNVTSSLIRDWSESVAAQIHYSLLKSTNGGEEYIVNGRVYGKARNLCKDERFYNETMAADCTAFLVSSDQILTAGHCFDSIDPEETCLESRWIFHWTDERLDTTTLKPLIYGKDVYRCFEIQKRIVSESVDFALIKLDRKVPVTDRQPLPLRRSGTGKIGDDDSVIVIGHPSGLPLKAALKANVIENSHNSVFRVNADMFRGNSGSPVFGERSGVVEGLIISGEDDFEYDKSSECWRSKICLPSSHCQGEAATRSTTILEFTGLVNLPSHSFHSSISSLFSR